MAAAQTRSVAWLHLLPLSPFAFEVTSAACASSNFSQQFVLGNILRVAARSMRKIGARSKECGIVARCRSCIARSPKPLQRSRRLRQQTLSSGRRAITVPNHVENVANQLECRCPHHAVWIDAQRDVVHRLAAMHRFRDHQLLVFRPFESRPLFPRLPAFLRSRSGPPTMT